MLSRFSRRLISFESSLLHSQARYFSAESGNPKVFFDIEIDGKDEGRITFEVIDPYHYEIS